MFHFLYFILFLAFHAISKTNSSEISASVKSLKKQSLYDVSSLNESEKQNVLLTVEFFTKIKLEEAKKEKEKIEEEKMLFFIKLVDSINTNNMTSLSHLLSNENTHDFSSYEDEFGYTLIDYAIINRNKKAVIILLEHIDFINFPFKKNTILNLLSFKSAQEARQVYSQTRLDEFLYLAALNEQTAMAELLLFLQANPHEKIFNEQTSFNAAETSKNKTILELLNTQFNS